MVFVSTHSKICKVQSPCRIDFAGGTADLWPLYLHLGGLELVHVAIDLYAKAELKWLAHGDGGSRGHKITIESLDLATKKTYHSLEELKKSLLTDTRTNPLRWLCRLSHNFLSSMAEKSQGEWELKCSSQVPPGSGLGGSSVLGVSVAKAFTHFLAPESEGSSLWLTQERVRNLEAAEIEFPAGEQDYIPALFGGMLITHMKPQKKSVERVNDVFAKEILDRCLLVYTGKPHHSGINNWQIFSGFHDGVATTKKALKNICEISRTLAEEIRQRRLDHFAELINQEWDERVHLGEKVNAPVLDEAWLFAKSLGASARKGCGAGGGGCLLVWFPSPDLREKAFQTKVRDPSWSWMRPELSLGPKLELL